MKVLGTVCCYKVFMVVVQLLLLVAWEEFTVVMVWYYNLCGAKAPLHTGLFHPRMSQNMKLPFLAKFLIPEHPNSITILGNNHLFSHLYPEFLQYTKKSFGCKQNRRLTGDPHLMRISLLWFFKTFQSYLAYAIFG